MTLSRKLPAKLSPAQARQVVEDLSSWRVVEPVRGDVLDAIDGSVKWNISFWDAMVLVAARKGGAAVVWSEDLRDGEVYDGVAVKNPFV